MQKNILMRLYRWRYFPSLVGVLLLLSVVVAYLSFGSRKNANNDGPSMVKYYERWDRSDPEFAQRRAAMADVARQITNSAFLFNDDALIPEEAAAAMQLKGIKVMSHNQRARILLLAFQTSVGQVSLLIRPSGGAFGPPEFVWQ